MTIARFLSAALGVVGACGGTPDAAAPVREDPVDDVVARLQERVGREADCVGSNVRFVCSLLELPGEGFDLPATTTSWIGVHFAVRPSRTIEAGTRETVRAARLTLSPDAAWVLRLDQTSTGAAMALPLVRQDAMDAIDGVRADVPVPIGLADELDDPPSETPPREPSRGDVGWVLDGERPARIVRLPASGGRPARLVVIEPVDGGEAGTFVAIFPDVPWRVPAPDEP